MKKDKNKEAKTEEQLRELLMSDEGFIPIEERIKITEWIANGHKYTN